MIRLHTILPARCACGSHDVENGYNFERHGYLQLCNLCGLEMFWSSDLITTDEADEMYAAYRREHDFDDDEDDEDEELPGEVAGGEYPSAEHTIWN
jgi:hypothetical protein